LGFYLADSNRWWRRKAPCGAVFWRRAIGGDRAAAATIALKLRAAQGV
jgi:hypothetical protein